MCKKGDRKRQQGDRETLEDKWRHNKRQGRDTQRQSNKERGRDRERERQTERYVERDRGRDRETDRQEETVCLPLTFKMMQAFKNLTAKRERNLSNFGVNAVSRVLRGTLSRRMRTFDRCLKEVTTHIR